MKPTIKDLQEKLASLGARHAVLQGANERNIKEIQRLKGSPKVQAQLNMANGTVAKLMEENAKFEKNYNSVNQSYEELYENHCKIMEENAQLKDDLQGANNTIDNLIKSLNDVSAENYALKAEIERTNRHINLAENALHEKEQPIIYNHYHNCVINK
jgi:chromosome segregation ATPase